MDLPPELRLLVYRELLVVEEDEKDKRIWRDSLNKSRTAILRTSKLVKREAEDVLYGENEVTIWKTLTGGKYVVHEVTSLGRTIGESHQTVHRGIGQTLYSFPICLAKIRRVKVVIRIHFRDRHAEAFRPELRFQSNVLVSLLTQTNARVLQVVLRRGVRETEVSNALQPLVNLRPHVDVSFEGVSDMDLVPADKSCVDDVLTEWFKIDKEVGDFLNALEPGLLSGLVSNIKTVRKSVSKLGSYDTKVEQQLCQAIKDLKRMLVEGKMQMPKVRAAKAD